MGNEVADATAVRPLAGVRVLDLSRFLPGGYLTTLLADLGADVIKVEEPQLGDPMRQVGARLGADTGGFWVGGRNKRSLAIDLKASAGLDILKRLATNAEVLVESFRPGVTARLGIDYATLAADNPALVYASLTGYGAAGALSATAGHDIDYIAYSGVLGMSGDASGRPALPGVQIADLGGASLLGIGLLAALLAARASGRGCEVEVSMYDTALSWTSVHAGEYWADGTVPRPSDTLLNGRDPCYHVYECADGRYVAVGAIEPKFWLQFCAGIGRADLADRQLDPTAIAEVEATLKTRPRDEWTAALGHTDACLAPILDLDEALAHPLATERAMVVPMTTEDGDVVPNLRSPIRLGRAPSAAGTRAPELGAHTIEILEELELSRAAIDGLLDAEIVRAGHGLN
jgi:crotonobetainyl-CoA:carnitine CoA-transferase CaiB-like acyl-CoA transferase